MMMHEELYDYLNRRRSVGSLRWLLEEPDPLAPLPLTLLQEYLQKLLEMKMHISDQFDNLEKHTQWGIDFVEKYTKFVKERTEIELNYARQIRNLSKKYQPKKKEEDENKYTWCRAFHSTLNELNDYAGQHEVIGENMTSQIIAELTRYAQEIKTERKACKRKFERDCKEADRAQQYFEKLDADINVTKADVEKARQQAQMRHQMASDSKNEYSSYLQKFNQEQNEHYYTIIPNIFQKIQAMEEKRIERMGESLKTFAEVDRQILPIIGKCLDGITQAAESIESKNDSSQVIESYKSGFEPPGDVEFEDYGQAMKRTVSETSLTNSRSDSKVDRSSKSKSKTLWPFIKKNKVTHTGVTFTRSYLDWTENKTQVNMNRRTNAPAREASPLTFAEKRNSKAFIPVLSFQTESNFLLRPPIGAVLMLMSLLTSPVPRQPPPDPPSPSAVTPDPCPTPQTPKQSKEPLSHRFNDLMTSKSKMHCFRSLRRGLSLNAHVRNLIEGSNPEDFSHLPPEQRRKKLQSKIDDINKDIQKEMDQRDALTKMKEVYIKNPQMGDPNSVDPRLAEIAHNIEKLQAEAQKFEGWLAEVEGRMPVKSDPPRRTSALYETQNSTPPTTNNNCAQDRESSPDGSYTEEPSSEVQSKVQPETAESGDEFDDADEEILPTIGTCKALYPFEGVNEGTISVTEGELLYVIEEDKGDGWTRIRRNEEEEGYVPSSYVEVFLDSNAKGAITYI
ncbi:formin-binding protein 1-like [Sinocyclocheilus grahami]|uniref:formin-binding protein 1-like n=1 Tax=Sinocyclocheilus grahami TaxID=75366 RepID=UPI0007ACA1A0|nr:PREDICTED: formin-binding protein 1-like [Sinocyclocheilus grahami]